MRLEVDKTFSMLLNLGNLKIRTFCFFLIIWQNFSCQKSTSIFRKLPIVFLNLHAYLPIITKTILQLYLKIFLLLLEWPTKYPECRLPPQSPARLKLEDIRDLTRKIQFFDYDAQISFILENTEQMGNQLNSSL